jgi:hypothetical protein
VGEQTTLVTVHKGIDLHAATALRVMRNRLGGGEGLVALARAEYYTYWEGEHGLNVDRLLTIGRFFNPNKHHYGHFVLPEGGMSWPAVVGQGVPLPAGWPGNPCGTDLIEVTPDLYDRLLGSPREDIAAVDVCAYPLGEEGVLLAGVLWRIFLRPADEDPLALADRLAVTRSGKEGLLVNPHMQGWRLAVQGDHSMRGVS